MMREGHRNAEKLHEFTAATLESEKTIRSDDIEMMNVGRFDRPVGPLDLRCPIGRHW